MQVKGHLFLHFVHCIGLCHVYMICMHIKFVNMCMFSMDMCVDGLIYHEVCLLSIYIPFFVTDPANAEIMVKSEGIPLITACLSSPSEKIVSYLLRLINVKHGIHDLLSCLVYCLYIVLA